MNSFLRSFYCLFFVNSISVRSGLSQAIISPSNRNRVVVFDIDDTLCKSNVYALELENARKSYPECPILAWTRENYGGHFDEVSHVFLPYLKILFDYLMEHGVRIVFFSAGPKERNLLVIPDLLASFWGKEKFEALKAKGQFDIFSEEHMREGKCSDFPGEGIDVKDFKVVIRDGEMLSDVILVEDDCTYAADDQRPYLPVMCLEMWRIGQIDLKREAEKMFFWLRKLSDFNLNSVYFMIGVFKTYFEHEKYNVLPLREGFDKILPEKWDRSAFYEKHQFAYDMFDLGLSEVRKRIPNATFYGLRHPHLGTCARLSDCSPRKPKHYCLKFGDTPGRQHFLPLPTKRGESAVNPYPSGRSHAHTRPPMLPLAKYRKFSLST